MTLILALLNYLHRFNHINLTEAGEGGIIGEGEDGEVGVTTIEATTLIGGWVLSGS